MTKEILLAARQGLHRRLQEKLWSLHNGIASNSDKDSRTSVSIGSALAETLAVASGKPRLRGSAAGAEFERQAIGFLRATFPALDHLRPGHWQIEPGSAIAKFEQYSHLDALKEAAAGNPALAAVLGSDYTIKPDIIITRSPEEDDRINREALFVGDDTAGLTPLRKRNNSQHLLHASVSCKWTIRSDRTQNSRAEALNLVRNRKGRAPHIAVVTAEPLPSRLVSIAIGTGDIDCTYHVALHELREVVDALELDEARDTLDLMVHGKRLRDVSDLPLDLAV